MSTISATKYLYDAKADEITADLEARGYTVRRDVRENGIQFDLVAQRGAEKIAYEIKVLGSVAAQTEQISRLREAARKAGYGALRLAVVAPPEKTQVGVEGLGQTLKDYVIEQAALPSLSHFHIDKVQVSRINRLDATSSGLNVSGTAVVEITHAEEAWSTDLPLEFDIQLDPQLRIHSVKRLAADTSDLER